jgi:hypothetical protein
VLERAAVTADPGETMSQDPAPKVGLELALHEDGQPRALGVPGRVGEEGLEVGLNSPVEHRVRGLAGLIGGRGSEAPGHGLCGEHAPCRDGSSQDWLPLP